MDLQNSFTSAKSSKFTSTSPWLVKEPARLTEMDIRYCMC